MRSSVSNESSTLCHAAEMDSSPPAIVPRIHVVWMPSADERVVPHRDSLVGGGACAAVGYSQSYPPLCVQYRSDLRPFLGWLGITFVLTLTCPQDADQIRFPVYTGVPFPAFLPITCIIVGFASPGLTSTATGRSFNQLTSAVSAAQKLLWPSRAGSSSAPACKETTRREI